MKPKDFQKATADRIVEILKSRRQNHILLADEVGLGKTIVARHVIQEVAEWHRTDLNDDHFKVMYICSNINIARQNYKKLGIPEKDCLDISESRLSMQHLRIYQNAGKDHSYLQLIPVTPATSFTMKGASGTRNERALMFVFLKRFGDLGKYPNRLSNVLKLSKDLNWWNEIINYYEREVKRCDANMDPPGSYTTEMLAALAEHTPPELYDKLIHILASNTPAKIFSIPYSELRNIINSFRRIFAEISLKKLEPDFVIMDEFQRYKDLISVSEGEAGMISNAFLRDNLTKVLLLSATPYKPFSTIEELASEDGDHYGEFIDVIDYLLQDKDRNAEFREVWNGYSSSLTEIESENLTILIASKNKAESALYQCICRTERRNDSLLDTSKAKELQVSKDDVASYIDIQKLLDELGLGSFPIEYVKSAPYLLSFMNYKIKNSIVSLLKKRISEQDDFVNIKSSATMLLRKQMIDEYKKIPTCNSRLDVLFAEAFDHGKNGAELMLWIPASRPYYKTKNVFSHNAGYSKILVFSAWEMVPRMIAGLTSYEAERLTIGKLPERLHMGERRYYAEEDKKRTIVNRLRDGGGDLIEYPSEWLAGLFKPNENIDEDLKTIRKNIRVQVQEKINKTKEDYGVPIGRGGAKQLLLLLRAIDGHDVSGELTTISRSAAEVFTNIAIASPAICGLRLYKNQEDALRLAKCFTSLFNKQEAMAALDVYGKKSDDTYYEEILSYCAEGNLQAVLDEFAFVLNPAGTMSSKDLCDAMCEAFIGVRSIKVDAIQRYKNLFAEDKKISLRTHFAVGYYNLKNTNEAVSSMENVRAAFNSPFKPFILSTTSIGQEGLDFHTYCRKIMHWNLPHNPIDLEQREGRVNRFLCHAIRQNLAGSEYANPPIGENIWPEIMSRTEKALKGSGSDLVPYWQLPNDYPYKQQIERIVPMYPYSQDRLRYNRMIEVLSLYRLTLGQPRQEELLQAIQNLDLTETELEQLFINLSPFSKEMQT